MLAKDDEESPVPVKGQTPSRWVVAHTALDNFFKGQVVTLDHLKAGLDREIDTDRLERLGAIVPLDSEEGKAALAAIEPAALTPAGEPVVATVPLPAKDVTNTATH